LSVRLTLQLVTGTNQACGTKVTPWIVDKTKPRGQGRKFRPPAIKNDGTRYTWTLDYDPLAADGSGEFRCTVRSHSPQLEEFERKTFTVALPPGYKEQGTRFDRFGLMNSEKPGNSLTIYFDDLVYDGTAEAFSADAGWIGVGNQTSYQRREEGGAHDFGLSAETSHAGGKAGELGGVIWRSGVYGYYADKVGPLSLADRLEASGKVMLAVGPPDSGMYLGWFHSAHKENSPPQAGDFVGVRIGGPTRIGHYFAPAYATALRPVSDRATTALWPVSDRATTALWPVSDRATGADRRSPETAGDLRSAGRRGRETAAQRVTAAPRVEGSGRREHPARVSVESREGPVLVPRQVSPWKLVYDPDAAGGQGAIRATLGTESVTLPLKPGDKAKGATLDRFGLFTTHIGGNFVCVYFDDLTYTSGSEGKTR
jgi:hypothetical protein